MNGRVDTYAAPIRRACTRRIDRCANSKAISHLWLKGNRFWPSDDDFRKAWRVDEEGIWLPQKLASDWPDIFWQHVVPRLDLESTLSLGQASVECRERVWGKVQAEHLHEKVLYNFLERSIVFEERVRTRNMVEERDRSIVWDFDSRDLTPRWRLWHTRGGHGRKGFAQRGWRRGRPDGRELPRPDVHGHPQ